MTPACAVIKVVESFGRSWTGAGHVVANVLSTLEAASCASLSHWRDLWIYAFQSARVLSVRHSRGYYYLCHGAPNLWGWTWPTCAVVYLYLSHWKVLCWCCVFKWVNCIYLFNEFNVPCSLFNLKDRLFWEIVPTVYDLFIVFWESSNWNLFILWLLVRAKSVFCGVL